MPLSCMRTRRLRLHAPPPPQPPSYRFLQQDCVSLNAETTPDFEAKKAIFFEEHLHEDAEVRVIVQGVGFFDVRDDFDRWVWRMTCDVS